MDEVRDEVDRLQISERFSLTLQRTLRIPDDAREYPLPPGLGRFPMYSIDAFKDRVPSAWRRDGGMFIPMYQREAVWLAFDAASWKPSAVKVGIGRINAVSGAPWDEALVAEPQDYIVCPPQLWLDGINAGGEYIRQFVAMPLGSGTTVEAALTGSEAFGGIQLHVFDPKPGRFPDQPPERSDVLEGHPMAIPEAASLEMGIGAGGMMRQRIYPDPHGIDTWDETPIASVSIRIVNSEQFRDITGLAPPPSPIDAQAYTEWGLPWFELYDAELGTIPASDRLSRVKSIGDATSVDVPDAQVARLRPRGDRPT